MKLLPTLALGIVAIVATGCGKPAGETAAAAATTGEGAAVFDFGRSICGVCCIGIVKEAFASAKGIVAFDIEVGADPHFTIRYDRQQTSPDQLLRAGQVMLPQLKLDKS